LIGSVGRLDATTTTYYTIMSAQQGVKIASRAVLKQLPGPVRILCTHGGEALKPQFMNERWRPPMVPPRKAARVRKYAILNGTYGFFDRETGEGWDPSWETMKKFPNIRAPKDHKRERNRESRAQKIDNLMETMDEKIAEHRQAIREKKPEGGIMNKLNRMMKGSK
jgi:hypothetical protein